VQLLRERIDQAIAQSALFQMAARPSRQKPVLLSRYESGMDYGNHVDDAVMSANGMPMRTDISFTLFLSDEADYEGGELTMEMTSGEQAFKLPAGSLVMYPSSTLHRVTPVTAGERLAAVGWCQSQVREPAKREVLFDLDTTRRQIFKDAGKTEHFDTISKNLANLQRMWAEP